MRRVVWYPFDVDLAFELWAEKILASGCQIFEEQGILRAHKANHSFEEPVSLTCQVALWMVAEIDITRKI